MAEVYEVQIKGVYLGQACDNTFHMVPSGGGEADPADVAEDMRALWRTSVRPNVNNTYRALSYQTRRIAGLIWKDPADHAKGSLYRFDNAVRLNGTASDYGARSAVGMPSMIAVGFAKTSGGYYRVDLATRIQGAKVPKGNIGIGGIIREHVDDTLNTLTTAAVNTWTAVGLQLVLPAINGHNYIMAVVTNTNGGIRNTAGKWLPTYLLDQEDAALPGYAVARCTALALNAYCTTRNTRKQSPHNLG